MASNLDVKGTISLEDKSQKAFNDFRKNVDDLGKQASNLGKAIAAGFATAKIIEFGKSLFSAFTEGEAVLTRFSAILDNVPEATDRVRDSLLQASAAATQLGFDDEKAAEAMANFFARTKDATTAIQLNQVAMDLAAGRGIEYSEAISVLSQVMAGRGQRAISQFNLGLKDDATSLEVLTAINNKYTGAAVKAADTIGGKTKTLTAIFDDFKQELGKTVAVALEPFLEIAVKLLNWFNSLPSSVKITIAIVVTLTTAMAGLLAVFVAVNAAIPLLIAGFVALKVAVLALSGPIGWVIGAVGLIGTGAVLAGQHFGWFKGKTDELGVATNDLGQNLKATGIDLEDNTEKLKELGKEAETTRKKIADFERDMAETVSDSVKTQTDLRRQMGEEIVGQQQKVADLQQQIVESTDAEEIDKLDAKLRTEQSALQNHSLIISTLQTEIAEAQRRASLTEFERRMEDLQKQQVAELVASLNKLMAQKAELDQLKAHLASLEVEEGKHTQFLREEENKRINIVAQSSARIQQLRLASAGSYANSTPSVIFPRASGGPVFAGGSYLVGEQGPELFSPSSSGTIIPNGRLAGAGDITINISGNTLLDGFAGERLADQIMRRLKQNLRF